MVGCLKQDVKSSFKLTQIYRLRIDLETNFFFNPLRILCRFQILNQI